MLMKRILSSTVLAGLLASQALAAPLEEKTSDRGVRYLTGGIGQGEVAAMRAAAPRYGLNLIFATPQGNYLSDVQVTVKNGKGEELLSVVSDGPMLLAGLPPGSYRVEATANGKTATQKVSVPKNGHRQIILRLPAGSASGSASSSGAPPAATPDTGGGQP